MLRKTHLVLFVVAACAVLVLLALPERTRSRLRVGWSSLFLPLFGLAGSASAAADRAGAVVASRTSLQTRVKSLELENERLHLALMEARAGVEENERLRRMLGYSPRSGWRLKAVRVIGRDPALWWQSVYIDAGYLDGVTTNLAVLVPEGLVGRVVETGARHARIVLVGDPNCPVAAALSPLGETGIIRGSADDGAPGTLVELSYLSRNAVVRPGQGVVTSGQGGVFPAGIPVGEVVDARAVEAGTYVEARVRLRADLGALHEVWVKLP